MRLMFAALIGAAVMALAGLDAAVTAANAQTCAALWVERNSYYKRHGYCFRTTRAIRYFGNAGCYIVNEGAVPLTRGERARIAQIRAIERSLGCTD
jgi:hypothetical protein